MIDIVLDGAFDTTIGLILNDLAFSVRLCRVLTLPRTLSTILKIAVVADTLIRGKFLLFFTLPTFKL